MSKKSKKQSTLYYFNSVGCAFCKQIDPIVEKLNKEGYNILSLDMAEKDNQGLHREIENKYDLRCGTPFLVDVDSGNNICGQQQANEENIKKWADGEEIPQPVRPTGPPPKLPLETASKEEEEKWTKEYEKWYEKNKELPNVKTAEQLLKLPRPKSEPPTPPKPNADDKAVDKWVADYDKWKGENEHLPGLLEGKVIGERFKAQRDGKPMPGAPTIFFMSFLPHLGHGLFVGLFRSLISSCSSNT